MTTRITLWDKRKYNFSRNPRLCCSCQCEVTFTELCCRILIGWMNISSNKGFLALNCARRWLPESVDHFFNSGAVVGWAFTKVCWMSCVTWGIPAGSRHDGGLAETGSQPPSRPWRLAADFFARTVEFVRRRRCYSRDRARWRLSWHKTTAVALFQHISDSAELGFICSTLTPPHGDKTANLGGAV